MPERPNFAFGLSYVIAMAVNAVKICGEVAKRKISQ